MHIEKLLAEFMSKWSYSKATTQDIAKILVCSTDIANKVRLLGVFEKKFRKLPEREEGRWWLFECTWNTERPQRRYKSAPLKSLHEIAEDLHDVGAMDAEAKERFDKASFEESGAIPNECWDKLTKSPNLTLTLSREAAQELQDSISDILCWCQGFKAGAGDAGAGPMGLYELREFNILLKRTLSCEQ